MNASVLMPQAPQIFLISSRVSSLARTTLSKPMSRRKRAPSTLCTAVWVEAYLFMVGYLSRKSFRTAGSCMITASAPEDAIMSAERSSISSSLSRTAIFTVTYTFALRAWQ